MKTSRAASWAGVGLLLLFGWQPAVRAEPVGTAFTYQGWIADGNQPANGLHDFQFKLFDANTAGQQIAGTIEVNDVNVVDGHFTVELDFCQPQGQQQGRVLLDVFGGDGRWLEIGIRRSLGDQGPTVQGLALEPYTILGPRQKVTTTPYALRALSGGGVYDVLRWPSNWGLGVEETPKPPGDAGGQNLFNVGTLGVGPYLPEPAERLDLSWSGGVNARIGRYNYLGSCFSSATFVLGNNARARTDSVNGIVVGQAHDSYGYRAMTMGSDGIVFHAVTGKVTPGDPVANERMRITNDGKVGIGTTTPGARLDIESGEGTYPSLIRLGSNVAGNVKARHSVYLGSGYHRSHGITLNYDMDSGAKDVSSLSALQLGLGVGGTSAAGGSHRGGGFSFLTMTPTGTAWTTAMQIDHETGNVGIGTATPRSMLDVGSGYASFSTFPVSGTVLGGTQAIGLNLVRKSTGSWEVGSDGAYASGAAILGSTGTEGLRFVTVRNKATITTALSDSTIMKSVRMSIDTYGHVGIGITNPQETLDVNGVVRVRNATAGTGTMVVIDGNGNLRRNVSSRRYKTNIRDLEGEPDKVLNLRPVRFQWENTGQQDIGLIAEEVEGVLKDVVIYDREGRPDAVQYDKVSLYLLQVVKDLRSENESLKHRLDALETRMERLERGGAMVVGGAVRPR